MGKISKTQTVLQDEVSECGAACLGMVLLYYGREVPLQELREACGVSRNGSVASHLVEAGKRYGLSIKGYQRDAEGLLGLKTPSILFWESNHYVVFEGFKNGHFYINDPAFGRRILNQAEFSTSFSKIILEVSILDNFKPNQKSFLSKLSSFYNSLQKPYILYAFFLSLMIGFLVSLYPNFLRFFLDDILIEDRIWMMSDLSLMGFFVLALLGTSLVLFEKLLLKRQFELWYDLENKTLWHLLSLPFLFFQKRHMSDVLSIFLSQKEGYYLRGKINRFYVLNLGVFFFCFFILYMYEPFMALAAGLAIVFQLGLVMYQNNAQKNEQHRLQMMASSVVGQMRMGFSGLENLKWMGEETKWLEKWFDAYVQWVQEKQKTYEFKNWILSQFLAGPVLGMGVIFSFLGGQVMKGVMTLGGMMALYYVTLKLFEPLTQWPDVMQAEEKNRLMTKRTQQVWAEPIEISKPIDSSLVNALQTHQMSFRYHEFGNFIFRQADFSISKGQQVVIVGDSGCGKTTLARMISGLLMPTEGQMSLGQKPILVESHGFLFTGTIRDNLLLFEPKTEEAILQACKLACLDEDIQKMPLQYETPISMNHRGMSGGQWQRLELARALLRNPEFLVLDEATSALDTLTEKQVLGNLRSLPITVIHMSNRMGPRAYADATYEIKEQTLHLLSR